jgi:hypothetical protein
LRRRREPVCGTHGEPPQGDIETPESSVDFVEAEQALDERRLDRCGRSLLRGFREDRASSAMLADRRPQAAAEFGHLQATWRDAPGALGAPQSLSRAAGTNGGGSLFEKDGEDPRPRPNRATGITEQ